MRGLVAGTGKSVRCVKAAELGRCAWEDIVHGEVVTDRGRQQTDWVKLAGPGKDTPVGNGFKTVSLGFGDGMFSLDADEIFKGDASCLRRLWKPPSGNSGASSSFVSVGGHREWEGSVAVADAIVGVAEKFDSSEVGVEG